jgi:hypothetical protein
VLFCGAALPLSRKTLNYAAGIIRRHRKAPVAVAEAEPRKVVTKVFPVSYLSLSPLGSSWLTLVVTEENSQRHPKETNPMRSIRAQAPGPRAPATDPTWRPVTDGDENHEPAADPVEPRKLGEPPPVRFGCPATRRRSTARPDLHVLATPPTGCGVTGRAARTEPA